MGRQAMCIWARAQTRRMVNLAAQERAPMGTIKVGRLPYARLRVYRPAGALSFRQVGLSVPEWAGRHSASLRVI